MVLEIGSSSLPKIILRYSRMAHMATAATSTESSSVLPFKKIHNRMGTSMTAVIHLLMCCIKPSRTVDPSADSFLICQ